VPIEAELVRDIVRSAVSVIEDEMDCEVVVERVSVCVFVGGSVRVSE
jgi:hypothetical protein